jgi:hypothetical protein
VVVVLLFLASSVNGVSKIIRNRSKQMQKRKYKGIQGKREIPRKRRERKKEEGEIF